MLRHRRWLLLTATLLCWITACGPSAGDGDRLDDEVVTDLRAEIEAIAERPAGGAVAWIDTPAEQLTFAAGDADVAAERELTADDAFDVASLTKMFTATVSLQLVEEGDLALDAPVAEHIPEQMARFEHGDDVTLRHLLSHSSGLPNFFSPRFAMDHTARATVEDGATVAVIDWTCDPMDTLEYAAEQRASFAPGEGGEYTDTNYVLAGQAIEAVTGDTLDTVITERIVRPLELDGTWMPCAQQPRADLARGYDYAERSPFRDLEAEIVDVTTLQHPVVSGATGLFSTGEDLVTFARALFAGQLFDDDATLTTMLEPGPLGAGTDDQYGLGVGLEGDVMGHDGVTAGYTSFVRYHQPDDTVVVVLSNALTEGEGPPAAALTAGRAMVGLLTDASQ